METMFVHLHSQWKRVSNIFLYLKQVDVLTNQLKHLQFQNNELEYEKDEAQKNEQTMLQFTDRKQRYIDTLLIQIEQNKTTIAGLAEQIQVLKRSPVEEHEKDEHERKRKMDVCKTDDDWCAQKTPTSSKLKTYNEKILHAKYKRLKRAHVSIQTQLQDNAQDTKQKDGQKGRTLSALRKEWQMISQKYENTKNMETKAICEKQLEKLHDYITNHPSFIEEKEKEDQMWEKTQIEKNKDALHIILNKMQNACNAQQKRRSEQLSILKKDVEDIGKWHVKDLEKMVASGGQGLCITELRAIYNKISSVVFKSDHDGMKTQWRKGIREKLKELTKKEENGNLPKENKTLSKWNTISSTEHVKSSQLFKSVKIAKPNKMPFDMNDLLAQKLKKVKKTNE